MFPNPGTRGILLVFLLILGLFVIVAGMWYLFQWVRYYRGTEHGFLRLKCLIMRQAGITGEGPTGDFRFRISGLAEKGGNVQIVLDRESSQSLLIGAILLVVHTDTREDWGTVKSIGVL